MRRALSLALTFVVAISLGAADVEGKKIYVCRYLADPPHGVSDWAKSDMVRTGKGRESRLVPYNSAAAQGLWLDATTTREHEAKAEAEGRSTSFYMVYDEKGWYTYIQCDEPEIQDYIDRGKDISLEIFFCPGLNRVPYYQFIVRQLAKTTNYYDWAMPHRHYRSLKGRITVESLPLATGVATFVFIPWEVIYNRLPLNGDHWRFSFMRWGGASMTWGGKVHDTGNFGLIRFEKPSVDVAQAIRKRMARIAWFKFLASARRATTSWSDEKVGDLVFYQGTLKPAIDHYTASGQSMGKPDEWDAAAVGEAQAVLEDWMEFDYKVSELRSEYLLDQLHSRSEDMKE